MSTHLPSRLGVAMILTLAWAVPGAAQVTAQLVAQGFTAPIAFVQDPSNPSVQVVVEQGGRVRVLQNGVLQDQDYLDVSVAFAAGGEQGLLGLAFAPDYGANGRVFVVFNNPAGNVVVSRFIRSAADPLRADPATRFDFVWPTGLAYVQHPFTNHNGGDVAFGPDGYLYIGMGDGGSGDDPFSNGQNPATLLAKMLRLDVSVPDNDPHGYAVPPTNPFVGVPGVLGEIWAFGLRNPWRWSFDNPALGGTGALVIGDVGQGAWEEVDYEPAGTGGGRNYGWRVREGAHDYIGAPGPFSTPLRDPIFEYSHGVGHAIIGGAIYRGSLLGAAFRGRYVFGDADGRVWSLGLAIDPTSHEATAGDLIEHTATLSTAAQFPSAFGVDAAGELYLVNYPLGRVYRLISAVAAHVLMNVDTPAPGAASLPFAVAGWAIDTASSTGTGVSQVHVWAVPSSGAPTFLGASEGLNRPDIAAIFGQRFLTSGFSVPVTNLPPGSYQIVASALSTVTNTFAGSGVVNVVVSNPAVIVIESPATGASGRGRVLIGGYALDRDAASGTGVDAVHVWAYPSVGAPQFIGAASYGASRPDVAALYGPHFQNAGWSIVTSSLTAGAWTLVAYPHSSVTGTFRTSQAVAFQMVSGIPGPIRAPVTRDFNGPSRGEN